MREDCDQNENSFHATVGKELFRFDKVDSKWIEAARVALQDEEENDSVRSCFVIQDGHVLVAKRFGIHFFTPELVKTSNIEPSRIVDGLKEISQLRHLEYAESKGFILLADFDIKEIEKIEALAIKHKHTGKSIFQKLATEVIAADGQIKTVDV